MLTQVPQLENEERLSELSVEPTVMTALDLEGLPLQVLALLFPAATTTGTLAATALSTAESMVELTPPQETC